MSNADDKIKVIRALIRPVLTVVCLLGYIAGNLDQVHLADKAVDTLGVLTIAGFVWYFGERSVLKLLGKA